MNNDEMSRSLYEALSHENNAQSHVNELMEIEKLTIQETRKAELSRCFVKFLFLTISIVVVSLSYAVVNNTQRASLEETLYRITGTLQSSVGFQMESALAGSSGLSKALTSFSTAEQVQWPWITLVEFELIAEPWRLMSNTPFLSFLPLVDPQDLLSWEDYARGNQGWVVQSLKIAEAERQDTDSISTVVYKFDNTTGGNSMPNAVNRAETGPIAPVWQTSPLAINMAVINYNALSETSFQTAFATLVSARAPVIGDATSVAAFHKIADPEQEIPYGMILSPIFNGIEEATSDVVGLVWMILEWGSFLEHDLPAEVEGVQCVLKNSCSEDMFTYEMQGSRAVYLGSEDLHDTEFDRYESIVYLNATGVENALFSSECMYAFHVYPTPAFVESFYTSAAIIAAASMTVLFAVTAMAVGKHESFSQERTTKIVDNSVAANSILSTLFPPQVKERLFAEQKEKSKGSGAQDHLRRLIQGDNDSSAADDGDIADEIFTSKPIADLFPHTTIMFGDIVGFTAWSSVREPAQVFALLENIYHAFDKIADKRGVFKVETVGDCYVAVAGLPRPRSDHAVVMARFATDCVAKMLHLVKHLEVSLGPDTGELSMRVGLHSGQVTAGVLRGKRSRFQLFGDTMNTASRMESTSGRDKIQISQDTADLLIHAGKSHWCIKRDDTIEAKGKGKMQTYWLSAPNSSVSAEGSLFASSTRSTSHSSVDDAIESFADPNRSGRKTPLEKKDRLIGWCVEVFQKLLKEIEARRETKRNVEAEDMKYTRVAGSTVLQEVAEVITLPSFNAKNASKKHRDPSSIKLGDDVERQLFDFVSSIASMYPENSFHNFGHVAHVLMSVTKLLSRIVAPSEIVTKESLSRTNPKRKSGTNDVDDFMSTIAPHIIGKFMEDHEKVTIRTKKLHDHTYGITSDPLTQFACAFSALIHDVNHRGVPNGQLMKEEPSLASEYKHQSVAEQVSVDIAWNLLMGDNFIALRGAIYSGKAEMMRFRRLVVNSVMATDIMDKDLKALRNSRWQKAFSMDPGTNKEIARENINRKATIVIEHIIQASDVAHTMQHWHVYRTWNERLFREMSMAYRLRRSGTNPSETWYNGELGFFDHYIIPLAKKLKECGVFGVSSAEYLNYAMLNREEWELKGKSVVAEMSKAFNEDMELQEREKNQETKPEKKERQPSWHL